MFLLMFVIAPMMVAGFIALVGYHRKPVSTWWDPALAFVLGLTVAGSAALTIALWEPGIVTTWAFTQGLILAILGVGIVPSLIYYGLGRLVSERPIGLAVVLVLMTVPTGIYLFTAALIVADYVACAPDQYECPV